MPFALSVPAIVRHEGGIARISYRVIVQWENAPLDWVKHGHKIYISDFGFYNADNKSLADGLVFNDDYGHDTATNKWDMLVLDKEGSVPTWDVSLEVR